MSHFGVVLKVAEVVDFLVLFDLFLIVLFIVVIILFSAFITVGLTGS